MKCVNCNCHFEVTAEEAAMRRRPGMDADFPFCSLECAKASRFNAWRKGKIPRELYHVGERDKAPAFGVWTQAVVLDGKRRRTISVNVGGKVTHLPFTDELRREAKRQRGRGAFQFGEDATVAVHPIYSSFI